LWPDVTVTSLPLSCCHCPPLFSPQVAADELSCLSTLASDTPTSLQSPSNNHMSHMQHTKTSLSSHSNLVPFRHSQHLRLVPLSLSCSAPTGLCRSMSEELLATHECLTTTYGCPVTATVTSTSHLNFRLPCLCSASTASCREEAAGPAPVLPPPPTLTHTQPACTPPLS
jgi:hypothetical protein